MFALVVDWGGSYGKALIVSDSCLYFIKMLCLIKAKYSVRFIDGSIELYSVKLSLLFLSQLIGIHWYMHRVAENLQYVLVMTAEMRQHLLLSFIILTAS